MKKHWLLVLIFIVLSIAPARGSKISIQNFNEKYGLAKKRANCLFQDSKGFIWFGMINGLYKFDQYSFTPVSSKKNTKGIPEADVKAIVEIKPGLLLIGTFDKGLFFYDSQLERSYSIICDVPTDFSKLNVKCLYFDSSGIAWIGTSHGLYRLKIVGKEADKIKVLLLPNDTFNILVSKDFVAFEEAEPGVVWYATMNDIGCYYSESKQIKGRPIYYEAISSFSIIDNKRILLGFFGTGAKILDTENMTLEPLRIKEIPEKSLVRSVYKDKSSNIWLNISNEGLVLLESGLESDHGMTISNKNILHSNLNSNVVYQISELKDGELWICGEDGINLITLKPDYFKSYNCNTNKQNPDLKVGIRAILDSQNGFLWVGTVGGGLKQFDLKTKQFTDINLLQNKVDHTIQAIMQDRNGNLWLGTEGEGLIRFYPDKKSGYRKGQVVNYRIYPQSFPAKSLNNDFIMCLLEDKHKNIWIGTWSGLSLIEASELNKTDHSKVVIKNFINNPKDSLSISNNTIMSLLEDNEGNIWVGTQSGLNKIVKTAEGYKFIHNYKNSEGQPLADKKILSIYQSKNGRFWFSNQEGGISAFDPQSGISKEFISENVFFDNIINSIAEDLEGNLWLGSNNGLCRLDQHSRSFDIFTTEDGLISNDFMFASSCKIGNELCFGLNNGLIVFSPKQIVQKTFKPNLVITEFRLFNKPIAVNDQNSPFKQHISSESAITLKHNQNFITIAFSALNYSLQKNIQYSCIMEGLETSWNNLNEEHRAAYTNMPPGKYIFRVKAYSLNDQANVSEISLKIIVRPPFWKTGWAYAFYLIVIILALFYLHRFFINREKQKNALALERLNAKRTHEIDLMRLQFFTNVSHEFRTPLTLIAAPLDSLINENPPQEKTQSYYQIMLKNVQRLTRLIDQLLDLRKIEEGYLKMEWKQGDMIDFIRRIFATFQNYAQKRNMNFTFQSESDELFNYFDSDKLDKILFNLFSNAFKYTDDLGSVDISLKERESSEIPYENITGQYLEIKITDSGIGIPKDDVKKLFKPFQQIDSNKPKGSGATGIGLSLTRELIELHKGFITVDSEIGKGSIFTVYLPVYKANPSEKAEAEPVLNEPIKKEVLNNEIVEETNSNSKQLVLIVEDSSDLRAYLRNELGKIYNIIEAENGEDGLDLAIEKIPDLVVSDIMMSGMDGIELCRKLKNDERTSHIPVILLTARHSEDVALSGYKMEADDYITKPFSLNILFIRVRNLIEQRRKLRILFGKSLNNNPEASINNKIDSKFLEKLNQAIEKNIDNPDFDPVALAQEMLMSKMQLYRKVAAIANQTVYNYIRTVRLNKAAKLLATSDMQIAEIALSVGFTEPSNFTKSFTQQFNQTPSQYIKSKKGKS